jgi:hypothetical protein
MDARRQQGNSVASEDLVMSEKNAELDFDSMDWFAPLLGWPTNIAHVPFNLSAGPRADSPASWLEGSNCQRFAYGILALFDLTCPPLRSSDLWEESELTAVVNSPEPLDLVFFNFSRESYGAHIGVYMAPNEILHLSQEIGRPAVWSFDEFATRPRYATIVGFKTVQGN